MKSLLRNKRGGFTDLFMFIIVTVILVFFFVVMFYSASTIKEQLHTTLDTKGSGSDSESNVNYSSTIDDTFGNVNVAFESLWWIALFLIIGMIVSIFIGSYMVTTRPVFFVPYIFIVIIAIFVAVGISNGYEKVMENATLSSTFNEFLGANFILQYFPLWIAVIGITGGIIMFIRMGKGEAYGD